MKNSFFYLSGVRTLVTSSVNSFWKKKNPTFIKKEKKSPSLAYSFKNWNIRILYKSKLSPVVKALTNMASILCFSSVHLWTSGEWECQSGDLTAAADRFLYSSSKSPWQHSQRNLPLHLGKDTAQSYFIWRTGEKSMMRGVLACGFGFGFSPHWGENSPADCFKPFKKLFKTDIPT